MDIFFDRCGNDYIGTKSQAEYLGKEIEAMEREFSHEHLRSINIYADLLLPTIRRLIKENCSGCQTAHPSQLQHDVCLMTPFGSIVQGYMQDALSLISALEVNRIARNQACTYQVIEIPVVDSRWRDNWTSITEAKVLLMHFGVPDF